MPIKQDILSQDIRIHSEQVCWRNELIEGSMLTYTLKERKILYWLSLYIKHHYIDMNIGIPDKWKDLYFYLTEADLTAIGGKGNNKNSYNVLKTLRNKTFTIKHKDEEGRMVYSEIAWIDYFEYEPKIKRYKLRINPEIMPYLVNVKTNFTKLDLSKIMFCGSKYTQRFYEMCSIYAGNRRYTDNWSTPKGKVYKLRTFRMGYETFMRLFGLCEQRDARTHEVTSESHYRNFADIKRNVIKKAQLELYKLYVCGLSDVWFDFTDGERKGRGGKTNGITVFVYTREHPKKDGMGIWKKGDAPLDPFIDEDKAKQQEQHDQHKPMTKQQRLAELRSNTFYGTESTLQAEAVRSVLRYYMKEDDLAYYMSAFSKEAKRSPYTWLQVLNMLERKKGQKEFNKYDTDLQCYILKAFVFKVDMQADYNWHVDPPRYKRKGNNSGNASDAAHARHQAGLEKFKRMFGKEW